MTTTKELTSRVTDHRISKGRQADRPTHRSVGPPGGPLHRTVVMIFIATCGAGHKCCMYVSQCVHAHACGCACPCMCVILICMDACMRVHNCMSPSCPHICCTHVFACVWSHAHVRMALHVCTNSDPLPPLHRPPLPPPLCCLHIQTSHFACTSRQTPPSCTSRLHAFHAHLNSAFSLQI